MEYISYCGLLCNDCPIYIATAENNEQVKERIASEFSGERMQFTKDDMNCYGCFHEDTKNSKMCGWCEIRICAEGKGVKNCAYCAEYPCSYIDTYVEVGSDNRTRLNGINKTG
ncbi:DUF3795 domain-containing protein [Chloroflexota bacterium]